MANPISKAWRKLFYHDGDRYFLLPQVASAQPEPPNEGPFGDAGPRAVSWFTRITFGGRHATPFFYTVIGIILAVLTLLEVWLFTLDDLLGATFVPLMLFLALAKFIVVVAFFMHLRFDKNLLTLVFSSGFVIAIAVFMILLTVQGKVAPDPVIAP
ncbi:MAG: hypothetical protein HOC77_10995 [Chloroflexi bacterium]|jgi:cytochrome c oxidase subunit IV|nr:hypothetical protein [Chloroflexota bacterium]MBT4072517.1 hypothetical protein [Chloroflexota bacterium]MBT4515602.1 hypothetical protein [Chloroflexota bacterium]MBT5318458.1 hypothetical protein [Chloroflexota bacterium]MBT6680602.1 hypothetical protein [Chloroflexota bacterium]